MRNAIRWSVEMVLFVTLALVLTLAAVGLR
jgi:predicted small lipoprotein YifL